ncbi:unnamed protein product [Penicillium nalgiovense]|nr:unnamed protein product [Penicillium nalgiovense]
MAAYVEVRRTCGHVIRSIRDKGVDFPSSLLQLGSPLSHSTMKVTIKEWNAVATWHWDIPEDEVCGICRVQFDGTCPTCKFPGDDCALVQGRCNHAFHMVRLRIERLKLRLD